MKAGVIKCTYSEIYDATGKKVFSLQAANFGSADEQHVVVYADDITKDKVQVVLSDIAVQFIQANSSVNLNQKLYAKSNAFEWHDLSDENDQPIYEQKNDKGKLTILALAATVLRGLID